MEIKFGHYQVWVVAASSVLVACVGTNIRTTTVIVCCRWLFCTCGGRLYIHACSVHCKKMIY